jgi:dienelactone hydrolase
MAAGRLPAAVERREAVRFVALGYAVMAVDSFGPRGLGQQCLGGNGPSADRVMDAYGALMYLAGRGDIDASRVALVGYSQGAWTALAAVAPGGAETLFERHFRAAVAYYPFCNESVVTIPTLILIGARDDWTPAKDCEEMEARATAAGVPLKLVVYPNASHAFNFPCNRPVEYFGHRMEYDEKAARAAWDQTTQFLQEHLGR